MSLSSSPSDSRELHRNLSRKESEVAYTASMTGDCLDVILVLPAAATSGVGKGAAGGAKAADETISSSDWIVSLRREGRMVRTTKRIATATKSFVSR